MQARRELQDCVYRLGRSDDVCRSDGAACQQPLVACACCFQLFSSIKILLTASNGSVHAVLCYTL